MAYKHLFKLLTYQKHNEPEATRRNMEVSFSLIVMKYLPYVIILKLIFTYR